MRAVALAVLLAAAPAAAQQAPLMVPMRDVAITYRSTGGGDPVTISMAWSAARKAVRMDMPGMGWSVANHGATPPSGFIVMEEARRVMDMPAQVLNRQIGAPRDARFVREGSDRIAGQACTVWRYQSGADEGRVCLTADGVMLRSQGSFAGQPGGMEATQVTYAPQDPSRFDPPAGYQRMPLRR
ncbi:hypothetical protein G3576_12845 [Roseomonas stagni]|uniref:DUF4412 domain-containing protein n=1 Tax=Falsiroseomonas algicola TaxID=2716930 RepID=A0A6M1LKP5_9PROT|nr:hypothetical protein [Falsiroseomonas algicola]NGM20906.1 hypothetical protein [Falsiroseomonas algicola]